MRAENAGPTGVSLRAFLWSAAVALPVACAPAIEPADVVVRRWLLCEECVDGELQALQDPDREAPYVESLARALAGPPRAGMDNVRRQVEETYQQLLVRAAQTGDSLPLTREQYVAHYLGNYEASYQSRAVIGLAFIGTPAARRALIDAAERVRTGQAAYRGDVLEELGRATGLAVVGGSALWTTISAGSNHTCGLRTDGRAYCWGGNDGGQLGDSSDNQPHRRPARVAGNLTFSAIAASVGGHHTCALSGDRAYCWGENDDGEVGDSSLTERHFPVPVRGSIVFAQIAVGARHSCGLTPDHVVYCWGGNEAGQLGDGTNSNRRWPSPAADSMRFRGIAAGGGHTCADSLNGRVYCWGVDQGGQLGDSVAGTGRPAPGATMPLMRLAGLELGLLHTCGLTFNTPHHHPGQAICWGTNQNSQLGDSTDSNRDTLTGVVGGNRFISISAGGRHTCGIAVGTRQVLCWGDNTSGQLGNGTTAAELEPVPVSGNLSFAVVSAGVRHTCGVTVQGAAYCWGENLNGQLGNGSTSDSETPVAVLDP